MLCLIIQYQIGKGYIYICSAVYGIFLYIFYNLWKPSSKINYISVHSDKLHAFSLTQKNGYNITL